MAKKKKPATRRKKAAAKSVGLTTGEVRTIGDARVRELTARVDEDGGAVLGAYNDPFGGTPVLLVALPIDAVEVGPDERVALLFGAEGPGLSAETLAAADLQVGIPMHGGVDSLNVGVAAGIACWVLGRR